VLTILPEETVFTSAPNNGHAEGSGRPKILQEVVVTANNAEEAEPPAGSATEGDAQEQKPSSAHIAANGHGVDDEGVSARNGETVQETGAGSIATGNGVRHASHQNGDAAAEANLAESIDLDSLNADPEDEKIGPHLPTLLERLRSIGEDHTESDKPSSPPRA
jgi:hypothetical protein